MSPSELKKRIEGLGPGTEVEIIDLTGTEDHYQAVIVSPAFDNKMMIEQHRMVFDLVQAEVKSGELHALSMKTFSPSQYEKQTGKSRLSDN